MKILRCGKCKKEKPVAEFSKNKNTKTGYQGYCKKCDKAYYQAHKEERQVYQKAYGKTPKRKAYQKAYNKAPKRKAAAKARFNAPANFATYAHQISYADDIKSVNGKLQTKCAYCGVWYFPTVLEVQHCIDALNGKYDSLGTENRLYCSDACKQACPVFGKVLYQVGHPKNHEDEYVREVQPELRQMVFARDNYTCYKCGKHQNELKVALHCHHIYAIRYDPLQSADIDVCVTACKTCHLKAHQLPGCSTYDHQCSIEDRDEENAVYNLNRNFNKEQTARERRT